MVGISFEVLTIKLSLHKLISELNTHCMGVYKVNEHSNIRNWKLKNVRMLKINIRSCPI